MEIVANLHMYSTFSDGKYSLRIILDKVVNAGLPTFPLSDHDTIDHIPIINACIESKRIDIQFIPAIEISCEQNGESILAHPGVYGKQSKIENISSLDLDGIEVYYPDHSKKQTQYYLEHTQNFNLLVSGGSDFHGWDNKISVTSFGIGVDYLNNIIDKLD